MCHLFAPLVRSSIEPPAADLSRLARCLGERTGNGLVPGMLLHGGSLDVIPVSFQARYTSLCMALCLSKPSQDGRCMRDDCCGWSDIFFLDITPPRHAIEPALGLRVLVHVPAREANPEGGILRQGICRERERNDWSLSRPRPDNDSALLTLILTLHNTTQTPIQSSNSSRPASPPSPAHSSRATPASGNANFTTHVSSPLPPWISTSHTGCTSPSRGSRLR